MVPVSLWFTSLARLEQETGVSLGPKFQRIQTVDQKGKKAKQQFREKIQVKSLKPETPWSRPHPTTGNPFPMVLVKAGLASPGPGSSLVWTRAGSEIGVAGGKRGQGRGQPISPCLSPPQPPFPLASASPGFCSRWTGCCGLLRERPGQALLSRQVPGQGHPEGPGVRAG